MRLRYGSVGLVALLAILLAGCGQAIKEENRQLQALVASLQQENVSLRGQVTGLKADVDALKQQVGQLLQEKQTLEDTLREAEAKAAVKPCSAPPLRSRRPS